ncbi:MAG: DUF4105 domain-containing protein [Pontibacterium sp.]
MSLFRGYVVGLFTLLLLAPQVSVASLSKYELQALSVSPQWRALLLYDIQSQGGRSHLTDPSFFISPHGRVSPQQELLSFYNAVLVAEETQEWQIVCAFPARLIWLSEQLKASDWVINCDEFLQWPERTETDSVSLLYAAGFLGNPASFFGHSFIKLNSENEKKDLDLLATSINYGAQVPDDEDPFTYIAKGVTGGYVGRFTDAAYYVQTLAYGEMEQRDLWEYELNLSAKQKRLVLAHIWELKERPFTYYFFRENCAYRIMQLLGVLPELEQGVPASGIVLPQETIRRTMNASQLGGSLSGQSLVKSVTFHPSRQKRAFERLAKLSSVTAKQVKLFLESEPNSEFSAAALAKLMSSVPSGEKAAVIDFLLEYLPTLARNEPHPSYAAVLAYRFKLPPSAAEKLTFVDQKAPHKAIKPTRLSLAMTRRDTLGQGATLAIRPLMYDRLDAGLSAGPEGEIVAGVLELQQFANEAGIHRLDAFRVQSVAQSPLGIGEAMADVWSLAVGLKDRRRDCVGCLSVYLAVDKGVQVSLMGLPAYALMSAEMQDGRGVWLGAGLEGVINLPHANSRLHWQLPVRYQFKDDDTVLLPSLSYRLGLSEEWDVRLHWTPDGPEQSTSLSVGYYF